MNPDTTSSHLQPSRPTVVVTRILSGDSSDAVAAVPTLPTLDRRRRRRDDSSSLKENGVPLRAVIMLTPDGDGMRMAQMLDESETIKRGIGKKP